MSNNIIVQLNKMTIIVQLNKMTTVASSTTRGTRPISYNVPSMQLKEYAKTFYEKNERILHYCLCYSFDQHQKLM
jgi:hypothetical protein